jgi:hypothetical protein
VFPSPGQDEVTLDGQVMRLLLGIHIKVEMACSSVSLGEGDWELFRHELIRVSIARAVGELPNFVITSGSNSRS